jgi:hypothetical protein
MPTANQAAENRWEGLCEVYRLARRAGSRGFNVRGLPDLCRDRFIARGCTIEDLGDGRCTVNLPVDAPVPCLPALQSAATE